MSHNKKSTFTLTDEDKKWIESTIDSKIKKSETEHMGFWKKFFKFLFTPAKKLNTDGAALNLLASITSLLCACTAYFGYLFAVALTGTSIYVAITQFSVSSIIVLVINAILSIIIAIFSKAIEMAGIDIEKSHDKEVIIGVAAFWVAFWPIAKSGIEWIFNTFGI